MSIKADIFSKTRVTILGKDPVLAALLMRLSVVASDAVEEAEVDGRELRINREWFLGLNPEVRQTVMAEAAMHCALGHFWRKGDRSQEKWDIASDIVTYPLLKKMGYQMPAAIKLPEDMSFLYDPSMNAESVYSKLPDDLAGNSSMFVKVKKPAKSEDGQDANGGEEVSGDQDLASSWENAMQQAITSGKLQGLETSGMERAIKAARSKGDWRNLLHRFAQRVSRDYYSWSRPNRRYLHRGYHLPRLHNYSIGTLAILFDTSGSMDEALMSQCCAEINAIKQTVNMDDIIVVYVDSEVCHTERFGKYDALKFNPKGGGGTDFRPGFQWLEKNGIVPGCCLYFTDMHCDRYPDPPPYPVLWITDNPSVSRKPPFGELAEILS